jgi:broad specificity phosphatase PhoE
MPAERIHLVRHGEVHNPEGVLYGRIPHFHLSERGHKMAEAAAKELQSDRRKVTALYSSPLLRTRESAEPIKAAFKLEPITDARFIEPTNVFEGRRLGFKHIAVRPHLYIHLRNPLRPSWGEPFQAIADRMLEGIEDVWKNTEFGDAVIVSHQLPIWMVHRSLAGLSLPHDPQKRRCALSSITTIEKNKAGKFVEIDYRNPAGNIKAIDLGAV